MADKSKFTVPNHTEVVLLECRQAFEALSSKEKLYAHYIGQASWYGSLACLLQTSPEAPGVFILYQKLFKAQNVESLSKLAIQVGMTEDEFNAFMMYAAAFYGNLGNYKSFGDSKFVPDVDAAKFEALFRQSSAWQREADLMENIWSHVGTAIFSLEPRVQQLGLKGKGITTYFSCNCDTNDAGIAQEFLKAKDLSAYNTRLFKEENNEKTVYEIRLASAETTDSGAGDMGLLGSHDFTTSSGVPVVFKVTRGDYSPLMQLCAENLLKAKDYAANDHEANMLTEYHRSFSQGSIPAHKEGSRHWIKNKGPIIETYIGFIESYRDPHGVRGEFEGFVAMVNKEMSAKFGKLVDRAEHFLPLLPWPSCYEKDKFLRPDFTSLDVLTFASSGVPAGINIPNYDDIRQEEGFKNVSLGNVLTSAYKDSKITFLEDKDKELFTKLKVASFEVQVGLHELLGHGSGKLFMKDADGKLNFESDSVRHTETGEKITSWYEPGESWNSKFQSISPTYEECRAECVGIYLCLSSEVLSIFGHINADADDIIYINWLNMVRAGLLALEFYNPATDTWGQAHMQARYVILRVLLEAGDELVTIKKHLAEDGQLDLTVRLQRNKINTTGKKAIGDFLRKLQVYKSCADYATGKVMYDAYSAVTDSEEPHFLSLREIVLNRKQPRKIFVQSNTKVEGESISLVEYPGSSEGLVQSFIERFPGTTVEDHLFQLWQKDWHHNTI